MPLDSVSDDYFSSISSISKCILSEKRTVIDNYGEEKWNTLSQQQKDDVLDNHFIDPKLTLHYQIQLGSGLGLHDEEPIPSSFPRMTIKTGQRMVHHTENDGSQSKGTMLTWRDEFSSPFTWETKCQQQIPLPTAENINLVVTRDDDLLDAGWKEETTIDGMDESLLTDFGKQFALNGQTSSLDEWYASSCSREKLVDVSKNVSPSVYRMQNVQDNLTLDLKSTSVESSNQSDRRQTSPSREKKSHKLKSREIIGSHSPNRVSSVNKHPDIKTELASSPSSMEFPSVTDTLLPKEDNSAKNSTGNSRPTGIQNSNTEANTNIHYPHSKQTWREEPKRKIITQQPTGWNENPMFIGNPQTNGMKQEITQPAASHSVQRSASPEDVIKTEPLPELDMEQFSVSNYDTSLKTEQPLKFTDFSQVGNRGDATKTEPAAGGGDGGEGSDGFNFLLDW